MSDWTPSYFISCLCHPWWVSILVYCLLSNNTLRICRITMDFENKIYRICGLFLKCTYTISMLVNTKKNQEWNLFMERFAKLVFKNTSPVVEGAKQSKSSDYLLRHWWLGSAYFDPTNLWTFLLEWNGHCHKNKWYLRLNKKQINLNDMLVTGNGIRWVESNRHNIFFLTWIFNWWETNSYSFSDHFLQI